MVRYVNHIYYTLANSLVIKSFITEKEECARGNILQVKLLSKVFDSFVLLTKRCLGFSVNTPTTDVLYILESGFRDSQFVTKMAATCWYWIYLQQYVSHKTSYSFHLISSMPTIFTIGNICPILLFLFTSLSTSSSIFWVVKRNGQHQKHNKHNRIFQLY